MEGEKRRGEEAGRGDVRRNVGVGSGVITPG